MTDAATPQELLRHARFVRALAHSLLRDPHAADDLAQDTWVAALQRPPAQPDGIRAWLRQVTTNFARRGWRGDARREERETRAARTELQEGADELVAREETLGRIVEAIRELDRPQREVVLGRFYEDLPPRELARRLGVPVETVRTRLRRGLERLRGKLEQEDREWRNALGLVVEIDEHRARLMFLPSIR